mgnify:FL=1
MPKKLHASIFKVFGNRERVQLLVCLAKTQSVTELLEKCTLSQSALSQHLKVLKEADLVTCARDGKKQMYSIKDEEMLRIAQILLS